MDGTLYPDLSGNGKGVYDVVDAPRVASITIIRNLDVWLDDHPGADYTGMEASTAALNAQIRNATAAGRRLRIPHGEFITGPIVLPTTGHVVIEGDGEDSQLIVSGANQSYLLSMIAGGRLSLFNMRLIGDGTSTTSSNGIGLNIAGTNDIELDSLIFQNFGWSSIYGPNYSATSPLNGTRLSIRNIHCLDGKNPNQSLNSADIYLRSGWSKVDIENVILEAALGTATHPGGIILPSEDAPFAGILLLDATAYPATPEQPVFDVKMRNVRVEGHTGWGMGLGSEYAMPDTLMHNFQISDYTARNCGCAALKTKNIVKVQTHMIYAKGCDRLGGEQPASGLRGTLLFNANDSGTHSNIVLEDCGEDGVTFIGALLGTTEGNLRGRHAFSGLVVNGAGEFSGAQGGVAVYIPFGVYDLSVSGLVANDVKEGVIIRTAVSQAPPSRIVFNSPIIRRTISGAGIKIIGLSGLNVGEIIINAPNIADTATQNIHLIYCDYVEINGGILQRAGSIGNSGQSVYVKDVNYLKAVGSRIVTTLSATASSYGFRFDGTNAYVELNSCDLSGSLNGPIQFVGTVTELRHNNNKGLLDGRDVGGLILNADVTVNWATWATTQSSTTTLTADRVLTLVAGTHNGMTFKIIRSSAGAFNLNVTWNAVVIKAMATGTWAEFIWNGTAWIVAASGTL